MVLFMLAAGAALRGGLLDEERRAASSAAYSVATLLPTVFLIFVFPRLPQIKQGSFHPSQTVAGGMMDRTYGMTLLFVGVLMAWTAVLVYKQRVRAGLLELAAEELHGELEVGGDGSADSGVVRPVPVSARD